jgi:hypothetical protein
VKNYTLVVILSEARKMPLISPYFGKKIEDRKEGPAPIVPAWSNLGKMERQRSYNPTAEIKQQTAKK